MSLALTSAHNAYPALFLSPHASDPGGARGDAAELSLADTHNGAREPTAFLCSVPSATHNAEASAESEHPSSPELLASTPPPPLGTSDESSTRSPASERLHQVMAAGGCSYTHTSAPPSPQRPPGFRPASQSPPLLSALPLYEVEAENEQQLHLSRDSIHRFLQLAAASSSFSAFPSPSTYGAPPTVSLPSHGSDRSYADPPDSSVPALLQQLTAVAPYVLNASSFDYHPRRSPPSTSDQFASPNREDAGYHERDEVVRSAMKDEVADPMNVRADHEGDSDDVVLLHAARHTISPHLVVVKVEGDDGDAHADAYGYSGSALSLSTSPVVSYHYSSPPHSAFISAAGFLPSLSCTSDDPLPSLEPGEAKHADGGAAMAATAYEGAADWECKEERSADRHGGASHALPGLWHDAPAVHMASVVEDGASPSRRVTRSKTARRRSKASAATAATSPSSSTSSAQDGSGDASSAPTALLPHAPIPNPYVFPTSAGVQLFDARPTHGSTKPKRFFCESCGKGFTQRGGLLNHERIHRNERPYLCIHPNCGRAFCQKCNLTRHERIHSGVKVSRTHHSAVFGALRRCGDRLTHQSVCVLCGAVQPYQCPVLACGKQFNRKHGLAQHLAAGHPHLQAADSGSPSSRSSGDGSTTAQSSQATQDDNGQYRSPLLASMAGIKHQELPDLDDMEEEREEAGEEPGAPVDYQRDAHSNPLFASIPHFPAPDHEVEAEEPTRRQLFRTRD